MREQRKENFRIREVEKVEQGKNEVIERDKFRAQESRKSK